MSSTLILKNANKLVTEKNDLLTVLINEKNLFILHFLYRRGGKSINQVASELNLPISEVEINIMSLEKNGLISHGNDDLFVLTELARKRISYGSVSLEFIVGTRLSANAAIINNALPDSYIIEECIGRGATSVTFRAKQIETHRNRTLKIFLPGTITYDQLNSALEKRAKIQNGAIPEILDAGQIQLNFPDGSSNIVPCVALTYINGKAKTFADFLGSQENINANILEQFIIRVGSALAAIEEAGLTHGDLHERNILVVPGASPTEAKDFYLIDFIGVPSTSSPELEVPTDLENFRDHLLRAAIVTCDRYPGYSARLLLGERVFKVLEGLRDNKYHSFSELLSDFSQKITLIPEGHFKTPAPEPFEWLRVEWLPSPTWLYKLFEPVESRYETIARFGNTWISGPRGCGKSHYLRVLAFQPSVIIESEKDEVLNTKLKDLNYDFKKSFGILFACRLGEFKGFTPEAIGKKQFDPETQLFIKHIIVLKIWNKALITIKDGFDIISHSTGRSILGLESDIIKFRSFLEDKLGSMAVVSDTIPLNIFLQCSAMCIAKEISAIAEWNYPEKRSQVKLLNEEDLDRFFAILKQTIPELNHSKFNILVDDASYGNMDLEMQKILNSLVRAAQANHCFKITCDKFMYTLESSDGRSIDPRHEVTYVDLGEISTKSQRKTAIDLSDYTARVINSRLRSMGYKLDIQKILGASQKSKEFLTALSKRTIRSYEKRKQQPKLNAYYAGWNIIWNISHGSIRTLLELVEYIFKSNKVTPATLNIPLKDQDRVVREFSKRQFRALSMLPGEIDGEPLGHKVKAIINAIGEMSKEYLKKYNTGEEYRWYETISVERTDRQKLDDQTYETLMKMVEYGLLMDDGLTFSRAQFGLCQRYDLNKIFTPAFETTYRVRNHIYLNRKRFTELLLYPDIFIKHNRKRLSELMKNEQLQQKSLFESNND